MANSSLQALYVLISAAQAHINMQYYNVVAGIRLCLTHEIDQKDIIRPCKNLVILH